MGWELELVEFECLFCCVFLDVWIGIGWIVGSSILVCMVWYV